MTIRDIRPDHEAERLNSFLTKKISRFSNSGIWTHWRKDGSRLKVEITSHEIIFNGRKARLVLSNDITERLEAEKSLLRSEANLRASIDNGLLSLVLLDHEGRVILADKKTQELTKQVLGKEMLPGKYYTDYIPEADVNSFHESFRKALQGEKVRFERVIDHGGENKFYLDIAYAPVYDQTGKATGVVTSFLNIGEQKRAQAQLAESEANLNAIFDATTHSYFLLDSNYTIIKFNQVAARAVSYTHGKELKEGDNMLDYSNPELMGSFKAHVAKALQGEKIIVEKEIPLPNATIWYNVQYLPVSNKDGEIYGVAFIAMDITNTKEAQNRLAESEANLNAVFDASMHSFFLLDRNYTILKFNANAEHAVNFTQDRALNEGDNMLDYFVGEQVESFKKNAAKALEGEKIMLEREISHPKATLWYNVQYLPVKNEEGFIYGVAFIFMDITQQKITELALKKSYQDVNTFKNALYNSAIISATDLHGNIIEVNEKFCEISKYTRDRIIGKTHSLINSGYHSSDFFREMWETIGRGELWRGDIKNRAKDGSFYWVDSYIHPIQNEEGKVVQYLSVRYLITDRKNAEEETRQYARRLDDILENITDGFFTVDRSWRFTRVNNVLEKTLLRKRKDLIGQVIWDVFPEALKLSFHEEYSKTMDKGVAVHFEEYFPPLDIWLEAHAYPAEDGISVYFRDISERKKSEAEIRKLSLVASKTDNTVIITNAKRQIEWVNEGFTKLTGYTLPEVKGQNPGHLLQGPASDPTTVDRIREKLRDKASVHEEIINYTKQGQPYWIKMDITPIINQAGEVEKFIAIQSNVTERKNAEIEKAKLVEELIHKNQSLEEYAFITSHNLRAPIAHILGLTALFNEDNLTDPFNATLMKQLSRASHNLDAVIKDLTELLAIRKDITEVREQLSLPEILKVVLQNVEAQALSTQAQITSDFTDFDQVYAVKSYLQSILLNLISNAIKYRHPGRPPVIKVKGFFTQNKDFCISVEDNGIGINLAKYQKKLFTLYSRLHSHAEGKGIGLHLVKTQAESMGGSVSVESEEGKGSSFSVILPNRLAEH